MEQSDFTMLQEPIFYFYFYIKSAYNWLILILELIISRFLCSWTVCVNGASTSNDSTTATPAKWQITPTVVFVGLLQ